MGEENAAPAARASATRTVDMCIAAGEKMIPETQLPYRIYLSFLI
jgi:hypothetical protein